MELFDYVVGDNSDFTYSDPPLIHTLCGEVLCTVEPGDSMQTLLAVAESHAAECSKRWKPGEPRPLTDCHGAEIR